MLYNLKGSNPVTAMQILVENSYENSNFRPFLGFKLTNLCWPCALQKAE